MTFKTIGVLILGIVTVTTVDLIITVDGFKDGWIIMMYLLCNWIAFFLLIKILRDKPDKKSNKRIKKPSLTQAHYDKRLN